MRIPDTMKAWVLYEKEKLKLAQIPVPVPGPEQVLVKIDRGCICNGSDPGIYHGHEAYTPPLVFGHEASGRIVAKGGCVPDFSVGDRVCWWFEGGAFAQYQTVTPKNAAMFRVPDTISLDEAPVLELVLASCRALMENKPKTGMTSLAICGLGPSGLVLMQYAKALGYGHVIGWDLYESRRKLALALGADEVYDPRKLTKEIVETIPGSDIGVLMMGDDLLPEEPTVTLFLRTIRHGGRVVSYGHPEKGCRFSPYVFQSRDLCMTGPVNDMKVVREEGKQVMQMVEEGKIRITPLITKNIYFEDFYPAFVQLLEKPEDQIKVILKWREDM